MKPLSVLIITLAPLLSMVDAVDGAPAAGMHRRAVGNAAHAPWHKRQDANGPPSIIVVGPTDPTTTTTTDTTTATGSDTGASTGASTDTTATTGTDAGTTTAPTTTAPTTTAATTTDTGNFLSSLLSGLLPTDPTTTTTDPVTTDPGTTPTTGPATTPTTDAGTTTDNGGGILTSIIGGITSDVGGIVSTLTSDVGGIVTSATSDIGGITTNLPTTITDNPITDPPVTTTDPATDPPTTITTPTTTDPGTGNGGGTTITTTSPTLDVTDVFPGSGTTSQSITTTITDPVKPTTLSIDSDFQFITASTFVIAPSSTSSLEVTNTDPDAVQTSAVVAGSGTTLTAASIPTSIPMFITPPASSDPTPPGTDIPGYTEISILFKSTANWLWVLGSSETAAQILAYLGPMIASALDISTDDVKTVGLKAFVPNDYSAESDLQTLWLGQIPNEQVSTLAALIKAPNSKFYHSGDGVADSIAANVVMSFNIATVSGVDSSSGASTQANSSSSGTNHSQRNAIIGVSVAFGFVVLAVTAYWLTKMYKQRQEGDHKRLSYRGNTNYGSTAAGGNNAAFAAGAGGVTYGGYDRDSRGDPGVRADSPPMLHNPFLTDQEREEQARGIRRNSFYAIGPDDESIEEETFDYLSQRTSTISGGLHPQSYGGSSGGAGLNRAGSSGSGGRAGNTWGSGARGGQTGAVRRPVIGQPISQPILRESSMGNW